MNGIPDAIIHEVTGLVLDVDDAGGPSDANSDAADFTRLDDALLALSSASAVPGSTLVWPQSTVLEASTSGGFQNPAH